MAEFVEEEWKDVVGFETLYQISSNGNIRNSKGTTLNQNEIRGYKHVVLCKDGKPYNKWIHRLVAEAFLDKNNIKFLDEYDNFSKICVNHKDENPLNNHVDNLEWCTYRYNSNYGTAQQRSRNTRIENGTYDALMKKVYRYDLDGNYIDEFNSTKEAMRLLGIKNVANACRGRNITAGGYVWRYYKTNKLLDYNRKPPCYQFSLSGELIRKFDNVSSANKELGKNNGHINECCNGKRKTYLGYKWSWEQEWKDPKEKDDDSSTVD